MSLFKRILGTDADGLLSKANRLFEQGHYGNAKLAFERASDAIDDDAQRAQIEERIHECANGIARARLGQAKIYLDQGVLDLARQELEGAMEVAQDQAIVDQAQGLIDSLEQDDALEQVIDQTVTDEERLALIVGQWEEAQSDEYDAYGDALLDALVLLHKEDFDNARQRLEQILETADNPRYLWLDVGRARLLTSDIQGGQEALIGFLESLAPDEGGEARLAAHIELARIADEAGDFDGAMAQFQAALEASEGDYRPYLAMGAYLRGKDHAAEAVEVLEAGLEVATTDEPNWRTLQELGLAYRETDQEEKAMQHLERVIQFFNSHQFFDYPVESALPLAELYEKHGRLDRAADIYRALSKGSDQESLARYHYEAGRVLRKLDLPDEARRMLTRAEALAEGDAELAEKIREVL